MRAFTSSRLLWVAALLLAGLLWPLATVQADEASRALQASSVIEYWALGDSIAAGTGLGDDAQGMDLTPCSRSWDRSYPKRLAAGLANHFDEVRFPDDHFLACSGAHVLYGAPAEVRKCELNYPGNPDCENKWLRNQVTTVVEHLEAQRQAGQAVPTLVTITAGANDLIYTSPITVYQAITWPDSWFDWYTDQRGDAVFWGFLGQLSRLLEYENVTVVVTDVHNPFNQNSFLFHLPGSRCSVALAGDEGAPPFNCYARTEEAVHDINDGIQLAVRRQLRPDRVQLASIHDLFHGHESPQGGTPLGVTPCGFAPPSVGETWIQYATDPNSNTRPFVTNELAKLLIPGAAQWTGDCVHPNDTGAQQYADTISAVALDLLE